MKAVVVYESLWGNTAAVAKAIAEGIGEGARAMSTGEAAGEALADVELIVGGAPLLGFSLPTTSMRDSIGSNPAHSSHPPNLSHPSMRQWLESLPAGTGRSAGFETRIWWSPGSAAKTIERGLTRVGYRPAAKTHRFIVQGKYGPLRAGELERAKLWGAELAQALT